MLHLHSTSPRLLQYPSGTRTMLPNRKSVQNFYSYSQHWRHKSIRTEQRVRIRALYNNPFRITKPNNICNVILIYQFLSENGDELHLGTISVPSALQANMCFMTRNTEYNGGTNQLFYPAHYWVKASIASVFVFQNKELYLGSLVFDLLAKRSTVKGPHKSFMNVKNSSETPQSSQSIILLI